MSALAPAGGEVLRLGRRQLYMLPTRHGLFLGAVLVAMLLAAVNYSNSLAYILTFSLGAVAMVSMHTTHNNVAGIEVSPAGAESVFAGQTARFLVTLTNPSASRRPSVWVHAGGHATRVDLEPLQSVRVLLPVEAPRRGWLRLPPVAISSSFPFGIFYTWSRRIDTGARALVYPAPGPRRPLQMQPDRRRHQSPGEHPEGDDFMGLREYRRGDPPRHVHWRAVARGQGPQTKLFGGAGAGTVWLDWDSLQDPATEQRLSQLCRWVLDAESAGIRYGLRLPGLEIRPAEGRIHRHECLRALARFRADEISRDPV